MAGWRHKHVFATCILDTQMHAPRLGLGLRRLRKDKLKVSTRKRMWEKVVGVSVLVTLAKGEVGDVGHY
jgi:hypothetical protein